MQHGAHRKRRLQQTSLAMERLYLATIGERGSKPTDSLDRTRIAYKMRRPTILSTVAFIRCRESMFMEPLPSTKEKIHLNELLPCNDKMDAHTDTQTDGSDL
jgi:hypothetical protein